MAAGLLSTANIPTDLAKKSFSAYITRLMPNGGAPLFGLTALLKDETAQNIEHGYYSKTMLFKSLTLTTAVAGAGDTTFAVAATANVVNGDMFKADTTNEVVIVNTVPGGTSVTVTRGVGTIAAGAIANGVVLYHIGNAFEEGSLRPQAVAIIAERYVNYTQIFRNSWAVTKTLAAIPMIAGAGQVQESKQDCAAFHALAIELMLFFGQKFMGSRNGQPFHTSEGIVARIQAAAPGNITTLGATTNWTQLEAAFDLVLNTTTDPKGSSIRTVFVGSVALRVMNSIARLNSQYMIVDRTQTAWGLRIMTLHTPRGTFELVEHPLFNAYGTASTWAKMAVIVDLDAFALAYLRRTENMNYNENGTPVDNGIDAMGGTLTTELTCIITNPLAFGIIYNFTAAAVG